MSTVVSMALAATEIKKSSDPKPIKLRSACNCCFAAKVRCDGNKGGCKRCSEKRLDCTYSESMVGKVVGKRRKRPLLDAKLTDSLPSQWNISVGPTALPSPAPTTASEPRSKRTCYANGWPGIVSNEDQQSFEFSTCGDQFLNFDMCQPADLNTSSDSSYMIESSLPTPSMSPGQTQHSTPSELEVTTPSTQASGMLSASTTDPTTLYQLSGPSLQYQQFEDDEIMLIRLLTRLKRLSVQTHHSFSSTVSLIDKTNGAIRRMLQSRTVRSDYACHLLLTSILLHLVTFCELIPTLRGPQADPELLYDINFGVYDESAQDSASTVESGTTLQHAAKKAVRDTVTVCTSVGNLLKRVPLNGFQIVGKNEGALIDLERRLRHTTTLL